MPSMDIRRFIRKVRMSVLQIVVDKRSLLAFSTSNLWLNPTTVTLNQGRNVAVDSSQYLPPRRDAAESRRLRRSAAVHGDFVVPWLVRCLVNNFA